MVFIASSHPVWRVVRRSVQLLTGAVMLTAVLSAGPASVSAHPGEPPAGVATVAVAIGPMLETFESTTIHAAPAAELVHAAPAGQSASLALTTISFLPGRTPAAALGERAPPRL